MTPQKRPIVGIFLVLAALMSGCGEKPGTVDASGGTVASDVSTAAYRSARPRDVLANVFRRYGTAESYRDHAVVRLEYRTPNGVEVQSAPLSVHYDRRNFYLEAYSLRCFSNSQSAVAWIIDEATGDFDRQVSLFAVPANRQDWEQVTADPVFQERLSGGLAGPPPQLDWLFASAPMKHLFAEHVRFSWGPQRTIEHQICDAIEVHADSQAYTFWVDSREGIIRQVQLPGLATMSSNGSQSTISLTIDFREATFSSNVPPPPSPRLPENPKFVRAFVPLPPLEPAKVLGMALAADRHPILQSISHPGVVTILIGHSQNDLAISMLSLLGHWREQLPQNLATKIRLVHLHEDATSEVADVALRQDPTRWMAPFELEFGGVVILDASNRVAWTQPLLAPGELQNFGIIVTDILSGIDVPQRLRGEWQAALNAYQQELLRRRVEP